MSLKLLIRTYPLSFLTLLFAGVFCAVTAVWNPYAALAELCVWLLLAAAAVLTARHDFKVIRNTVRALSQGLTAEENSSLNNFPLSVVVFDSADRIVWYNQKFQNELLSLLSPQNGSICQFTGGKGLREIREQTVFSAAVGDKEFTVYFSHIDCSGKQSYVLIFAEDTALKKTAKAYAQSKPVVAIVATDSADEIYRSYKESEYAEIISDIGRITENWFSEYNCVFRTLSSGRAIAVMREAELQKMIAKKFNVMEQVRSYTYHGAPVGITLSVGIGRGETLGDAESEARQALDMALGRGGDQTAMKNADDTYRFFGGVSKGVEKRTKVRTRVVASAIAELIRGCDNVLVMGHKFSDLDCIGAAVGVCAAASAFGKSAKIVTYEKASLATPLIAYIKAQSDSDLFVHPDIARHTVTEKTLLFVVDTHKASFTEEPEIYEKAPSVVVIDHHRKTADYIQNAVIFYHEPHASSACEMVTELLQYMQRKPILGAVQANALLAGIMLDTKEFALRTGVRTFEAAAYLRARGADTVTVKGFFNSSMENKKLRGQVVLNAQSYRNCAVSVADVKAKDIRIISAQAADELLTVSDVAASFVLFETGGTANISARSMGKVNVQLIMETLGGGGHQTMAAVQLPDTDLHTAEQMLKDAIDSYYENQ